MKHKKQITNIVRKAKRSDKKVLKTAKTSPAKNLSYPEGEFVEGIGRRKVSTARVRIYKSSGDYIVNDTLVSEYFADIPMAQKRYMEPFELTKTVGEFSVTAKVIGSGKASQLEAVIHGLSRALEKFNPEFKVFLKQSGLLTRDARMKETRKPGKGGKARRQRQSPKR